MKRILYWILPVMVLCLALTATPVMAEEESFTEYQQRPVYFAGETQSERALLSEAALEDFTALFLKEASTCSERIDISSLKIPYSEAMVVQLREYIWYEMPEAFHCYGILMWYNSKYITSIVVTYYPYADTAEEYAVCHGQMLAAADLLLEGIEGNSKLTDVQKALLLHDRLSFWATYDTSVSSGVLTDYPVTDFSAYGALGTRVTVCQGYTMAYMYLLDRVGIRNDYCASTALRHAWNIVYIDDKPYHVDVTWDDPDNGLYGLVEHENFLISTDALVETGHEASDYITTPVDKTYDDAFWRDVCSPFRLLNDKIYYYDINTDTMKCIDGAQHKTLFTVNADRSFGISLAVHNGWLLYSTKENVIAYDPVHGDSVEVFSFSASRMGWIDGFFYENGQLQIQTVDIDESYYYKTTITQLTLDLPDVTSKNGWVDGHYYENDVMVKNQWREDEDGIFFVKEDGTLAVSTWIEVSGGWCRVDENGYLLCSTWFYDGSGWNYLSADGFKVLSDWIYIDGNAYYCDNNGYRVTGNYTIDGTVYLFDNNGVLLNEDAPSIAFHPEDAVVNSGESVTFSVTALGKVTSYRWQYRKIHKWFDTSMDGFNTDALTVEATGSRHGYDYRCVITFADGTVLESQPAKLTVNTYIEITGAPNDQVVVLGYKGQFTVAAEGESLKYQWEYKRPDGTRWIETAMEGATKPTVYIESTTARDGYQYRCRVTDAAGKTVYSNVATMSVLSFKTHPVDVFAPTGETVQFTVSTSVRSGFTYQWQYRRSENGNWTNTTLSGYNTATLSVPAKNKNGYQYRCVVTGSKNSKLESKAAILHHGDPVTVSAQTEKLTASVGQTAVFTVNAQNAYSYQWYYCTRTGTVWTKTTMPGCDTPSLQVAVTAGRNGYKYKCAITGLDGKIYDSEPATLIVK